MVFFTQLFTSKKGPLTRIWLAAHWEKKLTKAHVYECNLEVSVQDIISPQTEFGLRASGHLLYGVVRIYSRKAKYLLADCSDAVEKIKMAFRPGQTDLPEEGMEAMVKAITLPEDFPDFDSQLPDVDNIDVVDHFSLNQSRTEDITLKEDSFLAIDDLGGDTWSHQGLFDMSFHSACQNDDGFGDEGMTFDLVDLIVNENTLLTGSPQLSPNEVPPTPPPTAVNAPVPEPAIPVCSTSLAKASALNEITLLENEEAFALEPVVITLSSGKNKRRRRRKLLIDKTKELSDETIRGQLADCSDILAPLELAPPTRQLMQWKETGGVDHLFSQFCLPVGHPALQQLFPRDRFPGRRGRSGRAEVEGDPEQMREDREVGRESSSGPMVEELSLLEDTVLPDRESFITHLERTQSQNTSFEECRLEVSLPESLPEDSMLVHPSEADRETPLTHTQTQSILGSQDMEEKRTASRAQTLLQALKKQDSSPSATFSLHTLCGRTNRTKAAAVFFSLLVLKKQRALNLHQSAPYSDIIATPGPLFHKL